MNYSNLKYHVPDIEINNRTVKERYHAQYHRLTFQNIPKVMIQYLAFEMVIRLKSFIFIGGLSPYYNPRTIVDQQPLDYNKHFTIPFGAFVQANNENNLTNKILLRTIDVIYLRLLDKIQGRHEIFDLHCHRVITR